MDDLSRCIQAIHQFCPDLEIHTARFNLDGQYNRVIILNDSLVFRFAKVLEAVKTLRFEIAVQKHLHGRLPLRIPEPRYIHIDAGLPDQVFVGYPLIPGAPLWQDKLSAIADQTVRERLAIQLAEFLKELHNAPLPEQVINSLPRYETWEQWAEMFRQIKEKLYPYMRADARRMVSAHFERYLDHPEELEHENRLRHGDFGSGNILFDPETFSITGIIDFGGVCIGDPAVDFAGLYTCYGADFYEHCCRVYPQMRTALNRVHFYRGTFALQEALFGIENQDTAAFEAGMVEYV
jgi:aminoglycoside 2''-phosphotransferase